MRLVFIFLVICMQFVSAKVLTVDQTNGPYKSIWAANRDAAPGDTVLVRGGIYGESVGIMYSGTPGNYITYKAYPGETPVLDGSMVITDWVKCASAAEAGGNLNWSNIYIGSPGRPIDPLKVNLYEGEEMLNITTDPAAPDPFFDNSTGHFKLIPTGGLTATTLRDASYFTNPDPNYYVGATIVILTANNRTYNREITAYAPSTGTVTFAAVPDNDIEYGKDKYSLFNHLALVNKPGEYSVDQANRTIYLWPKSVSSLSAGKVTMTFRTNAFIVDKAYVRVEGFTFRRYADNIISCTGGQHLDIRNNTIKQCISPDRRWVIHFVDCSDCVAEGNYLYYNKYMRGIFCDGGTNNIIKDNILEKNGSTGIIFYWETGSKIIGNQVLDHRGQHANGISAYNDNRNITISGNIVLRGAAALTYQAIDGLTVTNNIFHSNGGWPVACWNAGNSRNVTFYHNTMHTTNNYAFRTQSGTIANLVVKNNIIHGVPDGMNPGTWSHNLYTYSKYNSTLKIGEKKETDLSKVFMNAGAYDFRLKSGSPAINAGTSVGITTDQTGATRSGTPDMGAIEFGSIVTEIENPKSQIPNPKIAISTGTMYYMNGKRVQVKAIVSGIYLVPVKMADGSSRFEKRIIIR